MLFAFFPLYVTFAISVKNNKQFNNQPFAPLSLVGFVETLERKPAERDAYDAKESVLAREALAAGIEPGDSDWPVVRLSTKNTWHWENWVVAWDTVGTYIFNTIVVAVTAVVFALCFSTAAAFFFVFDDDPFFVSLFLRFVDLDFFLAFFLNDVFASCNFLTAARS